MSEPATEVHVAEDHLGPLDFVAVEFPDGGVDAAGFSLLLDLVEAGDIYVIDLEFLTKQSNGSMQQTNPATLGVPELAAFEGADSRLLERDDIALLSASLSVGAVLAVLIYEDRTMIPVLTAWESTGGRVFAEGVVDIDDLEAALGPEGHEPNEGD